MALRMRKTFHRNHYLTIFSKHAGLRVNECDLLSVMYTEHVSINQLSTMFVHCITFQHDYLPRAPLSARHFQGLPGWNKNILESPR